MHHSGHGCDQTNGSEPQKDTVKTGWHALPLALTVRPALDLPRDQRQKDDMLPILYSFRRCPYAMRARLAIQVAGVKVELREIVLRDKAPEFLAASPKGTVPVVVDGDHVIEESRDVMLWALGQNDPDAWLDMPEDGHALIDRIDGPFKAALDRTKYHTRHADANPDAERAKAMAILADLAPHPWLFGDRPTLADMAILPFVRQFAMIDKPRFDAEASAPVRQWLDHFLASPSFQSIMIRPPKWEAGDAPLIFPTPIANELF